MTRRGSEHGLRQPLIVPDVRRLGESVQQRANLIRRWHIRERQNRGQTRVGLPVIEQPRTLQLDKRGRGYRQNLEGCLAHTSGRVLQRCYRRRSGCRVGAIQQAKTVQCPECVQRAGVQPQLVNARVLDEFDELRRNVSLAPLHQ